jgi:hypothetical protein
MKSLYDSDHTDFCSGWILELDMPNKYFPRESTGRDKTIQRIRRHQVVITNNAASGNSRSGVVFFEAPSCQEPLPVCRQNMEHRE